MTKLVNLTPHAITFLDGENNPILTVEPSGMVARAAQTRTRSGEIAGITVNQCAYGEVQGLPEPAPETAYIVSALTAQACPWRKDVYIVDDTVRDGNGRIIGCRALAHIFGFGESWWESGGSCWYANGETGKARGA